MHFIIIIIEIIIEIARLPQKVFLSRNVIIL